MSIRNINLFSPEELIKRLEEEISYCLSKSIIPENKQECRNNIEELEKVIVLKMKGVNLK